MKTKLRNVDVIIIGGGPAGMAAAISARQAGATPVILEREGALGGILNQCIHNGFGLHTFKEELTGPEYAGRYAAKIKELGIEYYLEATVTDVTADRLVTAVCPSGLLEFKAGAVVLACGCRERPRGAVNIAGARAAGIYTAGAAQKYVNVMGYLPGKRVVILGSGDIGLIMARRMTFEGAKVLAVAELMPYSSGLNRNIVQCLNDFNIPLLLSHTVTGITAAKGRLTGVTISPVGADLRPLEGAGMYYECDTLLLSVGLLPENELARRAGVPLSAVTGGAVTNNRLMTEREGIFACGNVLHVHDIVDFVSLEAERAGACAAEYARKQGIITAPERARIELSAAENVRYTVPKYILGGDLTEKQVVNFRVTGAIQNAVVTVKQGGRVILSKKRRVVTPGEMERLEIPAGALTADGGNITVAAEEGV